MTMNMKSAKFHPLVIAGSLTISAVLVLTFRFLYFTEFSEVQYDDAYITYRYAANLWLGRGLVFNDGDMTNSASSLVWTLILAPIYGLWQQDLPAVVTGLGMALFVLLGVLIAAYGVLRRRGRLGVFMGIAIGGLTLATPHLAFWAVSGMETTFYLVVLTAYFLVIRRFFVAAGFQGRWGLVAPAAAGMFLGLTRMEGLAIAVVTGTFLVVAPMGWRRVSRRKLVLGLLSGPVAATIVLVSLFSLYYQNLIPEPIYFKSVVNYYDQAPLEALAGAGRYFLLQATPLLALALVGVASTIYRFRQRRSPEMFFDGAVLIALITASLFLIASANSDWSRYEIHLVPVLALCALQLAPLAEQKTFMSNQWIVGLVMVVLALQAILSPIVASSLKAESEERAYLQQARRDMGHWLQRNTAAGSRVLSSDIGALAFFNLENTYIDAGGLTNGRLLQRLRAGEDYGDVIRDQDPDFLVDSRMNMGITGAESIFNDPSSYFSQEKLLVTSRCNFEQAFVQHPLVVFPKTSASSAEIFSSRLSRQSC